MTVVRQRCVFYLSGFDPKGASHYHALYRDEAAKQTRVNGMALTVGPRRRTAEGNAGWTVYSEPDGVHTWYEFLRWDDVVRRHWTKGMPHLWWAVLRTTAFNLRHRALWRMWRRSWPPALALFLPFVLVLGQMLGVPLMALTCGLVAWHGGAPCWLATVLGVASGVLAWWGTRRLEARYAMYWMMRSYAFTRRQALGQVSELEARLDAHALRLVQRWREGRDDEIVVVGHSSGAVMAVSVLARALALAPNLGAQGPRVSFLTLGHCIPLLGLLPQAQRFRDELACLSAAGLDWLDFSAPPDGCCFALTDPYALCGVPSDRPDFPKLLNPRFAEMFDGANYRALKRDKFRMHFQYLMAAEQATAYDYFAITAGAQGLAERYAHTPGVREFNGLRPWGTKAGR